jgi:hypothetical protein
LDAVYASWGVAAPIIATKLAVLMIDPPVCKPFASSAALFLMARIAYLQPHHTPFKLIYRGKVEVISAICAEMRFLLIAHLHCEIPDPLFGIESIVIFGVHDT